MAAGTDLRSPFAALAAGLRAEGEYEEEALGRLHELLLRSRCEDELAAAVPRELSVERVLGFAREPAPERLRRVESIAAGAAAARPPQFRVFRREAPLAAPGLALAAPAWGRGAAVTESLGPFRGEDGRLFWFDFYPLVRLVPVYLAGDPRPALLFDFHQHRLGLSDPLPLREALGLLRRRRYALARSSFWLRADLLAPGAPAGGYVGLRITGGHLAFTPPPIEADGKLTIPAGGRCAVELDLEAPAAPAAGGGRAGLDAADAQLTLPATFALNLAAGHAAVNQLADASWTLYGQRIDFERRDGAPFYEPLLLSVLVPLAHSEPELDAGAPDSPLAQLAGRAAIRRAGWGLPVAMIDVTQPGEAAGIGGLAVQTDEGLTLTWRGLREGPARLPAPWVAAAPGLILLAEPHASNRYAHQTLRLWRDADSRFRSEIALRTTDAFALTYAAAAAGSEALFVQTDAEARLDRPVDVKGTPFPVHTLRSLLQLAYTDAAQFAFLYDDDILADSLDPKAAWPLQGDRARSLAIRNALFTVTPVNSLLLFAELRDEEMVERATLLLGMGLYGLLPTLPDPYAASVAWLRRSGRSLQLTQRVLQLLVASVTWTKAEDDDDPDAVETAFAFAPLGSRDQAAATFDTAPPPPPQPSAVFTRGKPHQEVAWDRSFGRFAQEHFALLDVSSNADQMGVSFAWFNPQELNEDDLVFYRVYGVKARPAPAAPLAVRDLDLSAQGRYVRAFALPQVSWEPLFNLTAPQVLGDPPDDPPYGPNLYPDDGGPTRLLNDSVELVPIAPIPVTEFLVRDFAERGADGFTGALFTLPFGLRAFAEFSRVNQFTGDPFDDAAKLAFNRPEYPDDEVTGALQLRADAPPHPAESPAFMGGTLQLDNVLTPGGTATRAGTLGHSVGTIFNNNFFFDGTTGYNRRGVPLTRIDFCGYGASTFSRWQNPNAAIAETSQARFDVFVGRTGHEVIQVRSWVYPWAIRVVRTITMFRTSSSYVYRFDTGWQPESDGVYDFRWSAYGPSFARLPQPNPYDIHPGVVRGVFNVRNLRETTAVPPFKDIWVKADGEPYVDVDGILRTVTSALPTPTPATERSPEVLLQPLYFDADVEIEEVKSGATNGRVPSAGMLGYVQLKPSGEPLPAELFAKLLEMQFGSLGGPVDCVVNVARSGQLMRVSRADVSASRDAGGGRIFVAAARGAVVLPKDGSWSVVQHQQGSGEVTPLDAQATVPLIRRGRLDSTTRTTDAGPGDLLRIANPADLVAPPGPGTRHYGLLQSTGTQKALFRQPSFQQGANQLLGAPPDFADAYRLLNTKGIFPRVQDAVPLTLGAFQTRIIAEGYRLLDPGNPAKVFEQALPEGPLYLIDEEFLKIYVEYARKDKKGVKAAGGNLRFGFDSAAPDPAGSWLSKLDDIGMVVDLGKLKRLVIIKGRFDTEKGKAPAFVEPELEMGEDLKPVVDILQILLALSGGDYKAAFAKGLQIAMSNSAGSWSYAFQARQEIPLVRFPPALAENAMTPFRLEAHLAVGVYFNEALQLGGGAGSLVPSAGAFLEFGGRVSVLCVSLAVAAVYATGAVDLRIAADIKTGPSLKMRFGFGAEIVVALPVVGSVSLLYMVGVEIDLDTGQITVSGFLLFRGRAELLGGIVTVTIQIEAKGSVKRSFPPPPAEGHTDMIAQVTFGLDISIFLIINIHFSKSWEESRQIA
jgi:hypothetical protein